MRHYCEIETDGTFDPSYGYTATVRIDAKKVRCIADSPYDTNKNILLCTMDFTEGEKAEETIMRCIYDTIREVQWHCERLHEGC